MQRVTLPVTPVVLVQDEIDVGQLMFTLSATIMGLDLELAPGAKVERVEVGKAATAPAPSATCRFGPHEFYPTSQPAVDPDVCPRHRAARGWDRARTEHRDLFKAITNLTGLVPELEHGGSGNIVFEIAVDVSREQDYPRYRGMQESREANGGLNGGIEYFATEKEEQEGEGTLIVSSWGEEALPASVWAARLAEHHRTLTT
ncbi:hypothetical protein LWF15_11205 [Kineosporia rhizophila]|uniref:hypothetical protein n=1 Tax=Kineosporia rhizophila TaxID=84633 RepID=UPI000ACE861D|nr:hypothetical protein [Kineosporia rhizophila]MCE0536078.1 hypothetical protein [Kineosporia rhizophila]